jgi:hypothetical protein
LPPFCKTLTPILELCGCAETTIPFSAVMPLPSKVSDNLVFVVSEHPIQPIITRMIK